MCKLLIFIGCITLSRTAVVHLVVHAVKPPLLKGHIQNIQKPRNLHKMRVQIPRPFMRQCRSSPLLPLIEILLEADKGVADHMGRPQLNLGICQSVVVFEFEQWHQLGGIQFGDPLFDIVT